MSRRPPPSHVSGTATHAGGRRNLLRARANSLLAALPAAERGAGAGGLLEVSLACGDILQEPLSPIQYVYFPTGSVVSLITAVDGHPAVGVSMIGREGVVGGSVALGVSESVTGAVVHAPGAALRMSARACSEQLAKSPALRAGMLCYMDSLLSQVAQTAACNTFHSIEARLSRWLLMTRDRSSSDQLELTHAFMGRMLGVRRVGITVAAGNLQRRGIILYARGRLAILDHRRLSTAACACYAAF